MKRLLAYTAIYLFWGASFLAIREVVAVSPPFFAAGLRFVLAGALLSGYGLARGMRLPGWVQWRSILLLSLLFFVLNYGALFWAETRVPSSEAAVIAAVIPAMIFLLEWIVLRRVRPSLLSILGGLFGLGGATWLVLSGSEVATSGGLRHVLIADRYAIALVGGAVCWAVATVISSRLNLPADRPISAGMQMLTGGAGLLGVSGALGEFHRVGRAMLAPRVVGGMVYLVLLASVAAFSAYVYLLTREPASRVASYAYINPLVAIALGAWLAGERMTGMQMAASGLVIAGTVATLLGRQATAGREPTEKAAG